MVSAAPFLKNIRASSEILKFYYRSNVPLKNLCFIMKCLQKAQIEESSLTWEKRSGKPWKKEHKKNPRITVAMENFPTRKQFSLKHSAASDFLPETFLVSLPAQRNSKCWIKRKEEITENTLLVNEHCCCLRLCSWVRKIFIKRSKPTSVSESPVNWCSFNLCWKFVENCETNKASVCNPFRWCEVAEWFIYLFIFLFDQKRALWCLFVMCE